MKNKIIKIGVITLGCPKNTADTESLLAELPEYFELSNVEDAELVLLNTCAFLKVARNEIFERLHELKKKKVILVGCYAGQLTEKTFDEYSQLYAIVSGSHYPEISEIVQQVSKGKKVFAVSEEPIRYVNMSGKMLITPKSYAYVKIAEGCDNRCSFCLIPKLKGRYRSRPMLSIISEIKDLISLGVKEMILVAQDCGCYGVDLYGKKTLSELLQKITAINGKFWIRILYIYPERIDDELLKAMSKNDKICKYLDIPLQHGDSEILKAMRRPFLVEKTLEKIKNIREIMPDMSFRTSLIVGFPNETEKSFKNLLKFVKAINFDHVGAFEYSQEEGTDAATLADQILPKIKKQRRKEIMLLQQKISFAKNKKLVGRIFKTLVEKYDPKKKIYLGRSQKFAPEIDGNIIIKSKTPLALNEFYKVRIVKAEPYDLLGEVFQSAGV